MTATRFILAAAVGLLVLWDVFAYYTGRETESTVLRGLAKRPGFVFAAGVLVGHIFFTEAYFP